MRILEEMEYKYFLLESMNVNKAIKITFFAIYEKSNLLLIFYIDDNMC